MKSNFSNLLLVLGIVLLVSLCASHNQLGFAAEVSKDRPLLAIWRDSEGHRASQAPYLRIAIWKDGRVVFAKNPNKWSHELMQGKIDASQVAKLEKELEGTGVFALKGNVYLVPDAPVDCMALDFDGKQQMLYWDEVETAHYGINISPKPQHLRFKNCWKEVNQLALQAIPTQTQPVGERFQRPPNSWYLKKAIQSE